jgi:hypothetical protein
MNIPLRISKLLKSGAQSRLLARARLLVDLDAQLQTLLAAPLQQHCRVLALREPVLVLAADSPVWAARLRFHAPQLIRQFSLPRSMQLRSIRVRVRPPEVCATTVPRKPMGCCGQRGAAAIQRAAENISDPELKTSLLKLASRQLMR